MCFPCFRLNTSSKKKINTIHLFLHFDIKFLNIIRCRLLLGIGFTGSNCNRLWWFCIDDFPFEIISLDHLIRNTFSPYMYIFVAIIIDCVSYCISSLWLKRTEPTNCMHQHCNRTKWNAKFCIEQKQKLSEIVNAL